MVGRLERHEDQSVCGRYPSSHFGKFSHGWAGAADRPIGGKFAHRRALAAGRHGVVRSDDGRRHATDYRSLWDPERCRIPWQRLFVFLRPERQTPSGHVRAGRPCHIVRDSGRCRVPWQSVFAFVRLKGRAGDAPEWLGRHTNRTPAFPISDPLSAADPDAEPAKPLARIDSSVQTASVPAYCLVGRNAKADAPPDVTP
jgi:hypothetical protein